MGRRPLPRPLAFAAEISGQLVILDLARDRYFLAPGAASAAPPPTVALDPKLAAWRPLGSRWPSGRAHGLADVTALLCLHRIGRFLGHAPFQRLVAAVADARIAERRRSPPVERLLSRYEAIRPFYPAARICRLDAPAVCLFLRRYGYPARLIFGARLEPFAAHCWAELDGAVINEPHEAVAQFRPILAV